MKKLWSVKLTGLGRYLPKRLVTSEELEELHGVEVSFSVNRSGVKQRYWADLVNGETASWMGAEAAKEALDEAGVAPEELDLILNASGTPEQVIPDGAPLIQRHLGIGDSGIACMSVHSTCLSFLSALEVAAERIEAGRVDKVLIVSTDITSVGLDTDDRETLSLFGDAAAAAVVEATPPGEASAIHRFVFKTYGRAAYLTQVPGGGTRNHPNQPQTTSRDNCFQMDGRKVLGVAVDRAPEVMQELGVPELGDQIDWVIPHQTSRAGLRALSWLGFPREKMVETLSTQGNCVAASIPSTLYEAARHRGLKRGDLCLMCGTGAGLSLGGALFTY